MEASAHNAIHPQRKPTRQTARLLHELTASDAEKWHYGYDLAQTTGLRSNSIYSILDRLDDAGLINHQWDMAGPRPRHLVRLTDAGRVYAHETLALFMQKASTAPRTAKAY